MKNKILIIEDEGAISQLLAMNLEAVGYETEICEDGKEAEDYLTKYEREAADLALVDIMLPKKDGFQLMDYFQKYKIPVIYLTAKADVGSKVKGLKLGAEDYIVKPFEVLELLVRMEKALERNGKLSSLLIYKGLTMDLAKHKVYEDGKEISLKPMEFSLLSVFLKNRNVVLGRDRLLNMVWGSEYYGETRTVDVHIARLRKKIKACNDIVTIPKARYLLEDNV